MFSNYLKFWDTLLHGHLSATASTSSQRVQVKIFQIALNGARRTCFATCSITIQESCNLPIVDGGLLCDNDNRHKRHYRL